MKDTSLLLASTVLALGIICIDSSSYAAIDDMLRGQAFPVILKKTAPTTAESSAVAHYAMGVIYDNDGKINEAIKEYKEALRYDKRSGAAHARIGADYLLQNDIKNAISHLLLAKKYDPEGIKPRVLLALIYTTQRRFD